MTVPPELQPLLDAYVACTGLAVSLSYQRQLALTELHARGLTADDVRAVLERLKRLIARGEKGYTENSLDFRNTLGNADTFEERALRLRQEAFRRAKPKQEVAKTTALPNGDSITVLTTATEKEPVQMNRDLIAETMQAMAKEIAKEGI